MRYSNRIFPFLLRVQITSFPFYQGKWLVLVSNHLYLQLMCLLRAHQNFKGVLIDALKIRFCHFLSVKELPDLIAFIYKVCLLPFYNDVLVRILIFVNLQFTIFFLLFEVLQATRSLSWFLKVRVYEVLRISWTVTEFK